MKLQTTEGVPYSRLPHPHRQFESQGKPLLCQALTVSDICTTLDALSGKSNQQLSPRLPHALCNGAQAPRTNVLGKSLFLERPFLGKREHDAYFDWPPLLKAGYWPFGLAHFAKSELPPPSSWGRRQGSNHQNGQQETADHEAALENLGVRMSSGWRGTFSFAGPVRICSRPGPVRAFCKVFRG